MQDLYRKTYDLTTESRRYIPRYLCRGSLSSAMAFRTPEARPAVLPINHRTHLAIKNYEAVSRMGWASVREIGWQTPRCPCCDTLAARGALAGQGCSCPTCTSSATCTCVTHTAQGRVVVIFTEGQGALFPHPFPADHGDYAVYLQSRDPPEVHAAQYGRPDSDNYFTRAFRELWRPGMTLSDRLGYGPPGTESASEAGNAAAEGRDDQGSQAGDVDVGAGLVESNHTSYGPEIERYQANPEGPPLTVRCSICFQDIQYPALPARDGSNNPEPPVRLLPCQHIFGMHCLNAMSCVIDDVVRNCPICRTEISEATEVTAAADTICPSVSR